jgi:hypothetical protein
MATPTIATITYAGSVFGSSILTSPWAAVGCVFPGRGGIPTSPQFSGEVLQPMNVDGARYRVAGAHFPPFKMLTIVGAVDYFTANSMAREMELTKGDFITVEFSGQSATLFVIDCKAIPSAKQILGSTAAYTFGTQASNASIDTEWDLQVVSS